MHREGHGSSGELRCIARTAALHSWAKFKENQSDCILLRGASGGG